MNRCLQAAQALAMQQAAAARQPTEVIEIAKLDFFVDSLFRFNAVTSRSAKSEFTFKNYHYLTKILTADRHRCQPKNL